MDGLLRPGEFASRVRLSPKALRLYAEQGLLVPARLDERTGYRFYAVDQIDRGHRRADDADGGPVLDVAWPVER